MARWLALPMPHPGTHLYIHNALATTFTVGCVAAIIAIISALCSSCHKKPKQKIRSKASYSNKPSPEIPAWNSEFAAATTHIHEIQQNVNRNNPISTLKEETKVVKLTPDMATHGPIPPAMLPSPTRSASKHRLSLSLSKKLPSRKLHDMMRASRKEKKEAAEPGEDMIWKKAIILGEKCRVPTDDDEEEGGAKNYYSKTPRSRPMSRANSFASHGVAERTSSVAPSDLNLERREE
ncbi:hypothetical protein LUZ62_022268 [Rhynchospora pubera]|uniref:Uncharacterized protein n=1 Tax=Rhynchospora pubera TaxID=906938 RepID=A0AAV8H4N1_9POAL|nr:hypothetical protein LUZ62_022268 [Rhynchospora pubera]